MITLIPEPWVREALCARAGHPDAYHADKQTPRHLVHDALALCAVCPVRAQCLNDALVRHDRYGIWGGTSEEERAEMFKDSA